MVAELLVGWQQRCKINAVKTGEALLRAFCNDLLAQQVGSITDYVIAAGRGLQFTGLVNCLIGHARRALSSPETEVAAIASLTVAPDDQPWSFWWTLLFPGRSVSRCVNVAHECRAL